MSEDSYLTYGTEKSKLLQEVIAAGFKPIAITVMMCEETFIFKGEDEAKKAADMFLPEGWWYGLDHFYRDFDQYVRDIHGKIKGMYDIDFELDTYICWLDENFRPKQNHRQYTDFNEIKNSFNDYGKTR